MADLGAVAIKFDPSETFVSLRVSGTVLDSTGNPAIRQMIAIASSTLGNPFPSITGTCYSRSDGTYELACGVNTSEVTILCKDDSAGTIYNDLVHRVVPL